jgi:DNA-binding PadR family transcriptional regulator
VITSTEASILGLLAHGELSAYELVKTAGRSVGYFWAPATSQFYAVLPRLVETGLASSRVVRQSSRPDKRVYRISAAGRDALREWINGPTPAEPSRNPLLLQLFFGDHGDPQALLEHVRERRREFEELEAELKQIDEHATARQNDFYPSLTRRYGHEYARALIRWARATEEDLARQVST